MLSGLVEKWIPCTIAVLFVFLIGCAEDQGASSPDVSPPSDSGDLKVDVGATEGVESLVDLSLFEPVAEEDDPFVSHRPDEVNCETGYALEIGVFEVETDKCNYGTFAQPMKVELDSTDQVRLVIWHLALWAAEPAEAHVAIQIGEHLIWEAFSPIPGAEEIWDVTLELESSIPAGTPVYFHVHNHGYNSWRLGLIERIRD